MGFPSGHKPFVFRRDFPLGSLFKSESSEGKPFGIKHYTQLFGIHSEKFVSQQDLSRNEHDQFCIL